MLLDRMEYTGLLAFRGSQGHRAPREIQVSWAPMGNQVFQAWAAGQVTQVIVVKLDPSARKAFKDWKGHRVVQVALVCQACQAAVLASGTF